MAAFYPPIVKGACGVFGVVRKPSAPVISSDVPLRAIECVRFRGSSLGAGFAAFHTFNGQGAPYHVQVFVDSAATLAEVRAMWLANPLLRLQAEVLPRFTNGHGFETWIGEVEAASPAPVCATVFTVNERMSQNGGIRARAYAYGQGLEVFKGVGYPAEVAQRHGLERGARSADVWIAHTRQPTNSPGTLPIWSHPFAAGNWAIVHNGDISSYGANMEYLWSRGARSFVGTDSEAIALLLDHLTRIEGLTVEDAALVLTNPHERQLQRLGEPTATLLRSLIARHRGACLDGPFTVVAGYTDGREAYLLALVDRFKFRPIVVGEDAERIFVASEECQIRAVSPHASIWTIEPGRLFLASSRRGVIVAGRHARELFYESSRGLIPALRSRPSQTDAVVIDAAGLDYHQVNEAIKAAFDHSCREAHVTNVCGQRYLGVNLRSGTLTLYGTPGNCLANFNSGVDITVYGNVADDVADTMHAGRVVVHGDARDILGQALQGGEILIRGSAGNRTAIQMREYQDRRPYLIVGGGVDDYFGEYMAGGIAVVLGLGALESGFTEPLVGDFVGSGMVGGRIYIRGRVPRDRIGLPPPRADVLQYLRSLSIEGMLAPPVLSELERDELTPDRLQAGLPEPAWRRVRRLYESRYTAPLHVDYRMLNEHDRRLLEPSLQRFFGEFGLGPKLYEAVLTSMFTIITTASKQGATASVEQPAEE